jgi:hypothetical protein
MMKSNNNQISVSSVEPYPDTRIQDQPILTTVFIATAKYEYIILCNYSVYIALSLHHGVIISYGHDAMPLKS